MDKATLVSLDIEAGSRVVSLLENAGITVKVAVWMTTPEYEEGRLVLASAQLDQTNPLHAYEQVAQVLQGEFSYSPPAILILKMKDSFVQHLRQLFGKTKSVEGLRLGGQVIGNRFVSDAYVYQIR